MPDKFDLNAFKQDLDDTLAKSKEAFQGKYKDELNALAGLSKEEIHAMIPDIADMEVYDNLLTVVKEASRVNLHQSQLKEQINSLGSVAVSLASKVPGLGMLFG